VARPETETTEEERTRSRVQFESDAVILVDEKNDITG